MVFVQDAMMFHNTALILQNYHIFAKYFPFIYLFALVKDSSCLKFQELPDTQPLLVIGVQVYAYILLFVHNLEAFYYFANPQSDSMRARKELKVLGLCANDNSHWFSISASNSSILGNVSLKFSGRICMPSYAVIAMGWL